MNSAEYGVYNYMYYGTGTGYGTSNQIRSNIWHVQLVHRVSNYGYAYGAYNRGGRYGARITMGRAIPTVHIVSIETTTKLF